jgi:hypothetical protein
MSFNYARAALTATRLIKNFGKGSAPVKPLPNDNAIIRISKTGPAYNPVLTETLHPCQLAVVEYEKTERDGTLIMVGDKKAFVAVEGVTIEPTTADRLIIDGESHAIMDVLPLKPGATVVCWEMQVRR